MKFRWTIKELNENTDNFILRGIVVERRSELTNIYSPLSKRLNEIFNVLDKKVQTEQITGKSYDGFVIQVFLEILRNKTSLKGDEIMKVERLIKEKLVASRR